LNHAPRIVFASDGNYKFVPSIGIGGPASYKRTSADYVTKFYSLLNKWNSETFYISSTRQLTEHQAFKAIIKMGELVIPLIVSEIRKEPSLLVLALVLITGEDAVIPSDKGNVRAMTDAWLLWAKRNGY